MHQLYHLILHKSSALVEAKTFQISTENFVNMNSTSSHCKKKLPYKKLYSSKKKKIICYTL